MNIISPIRKSIISASVLAALPKKGVPGKWYRVDDSVYLWSDIDQDYFEVGAGGPGSSTWGGITGTLTDQTDLVAELDSRESAANAYADSLVVGLWDDRGSFDASGGAYPSSGGSGTAGAILKGDVWTISVAGTLPTGQVVEVGDLIRALVDSPGNTQANWAITQNNIGFTPFNAANVDTDGTLAADSDSKVASQKATKTYVDTEIASITRGPSLFTNNSTITHTGTTVETIVFSQLIPAGTFDSGDLFEFYSLISATSNSNNKTFRLYFNSSVAIPGSSNLYATFIGTTNALYAYFQRFIFFQTVSSQIFYLKTGNAPGSYNANSSGYSTNTIDFSVDQYLIITVQLANSADNAYVYGIKSFLNR